MIAKYDVWKQQQSKSHFKVGGSAELDLINYITFAIRMKRMNKKKGSARLDAMKMKREMRLMKNECDKTKRRFHGLDLDLFSLASSWVESSLDFIADKSSYHHHHHHHLPSSSYGTNTAGVNAAPLMSEDSAEIISYRTLINTAYSSVSCLLACSNSLLRSRKDQTGLKL